MKKKIILLSAAVFLVFLNGCSRKINGENIKAGIVMSIGGRGDKSYNDAAYRGLETAKKDFGIEFDFVEPVSPAEDEKYLRQYAEAGYDIVFAVGFLMKESCAKVASEYPDVKFAIIDSDIDLPNVASLTFKENEIAFLVGAIAAMVTHTDTIGFIGGMEVPLIKKLQFGFEQGISYVNPDIRVISMYTDSPYPFNDPVKGKENTLVLLNQGADVIYHVAGVTGAGVFEACEEYNQNIDDGEKVWAIGVDTSRNSMVPGTIPASMMKYVDVAVYKTVQNLCRGKFSGKVYSFGVADGGIGTTDFDFSKKRLPADAETRLKDIEDKIRSGKITIEDL